MIEHTAKTKGLFDVRKTLFNDNNIKMRDMPSHGLRYLPRWCIVWITQVSPLKFRYNISNYILRVNALVAWKWRFNGKKSYNMALLYIMKCSIRLYHNFCLSFK